MKSQREKLCHFVSNLSQIVIVKGSEILGSCSWRCGLRLLWDSLIERLFNPVLFFNYSIWRDRTDLNPRLDLRRLANILFYSLKFWAFFSTFINKLIQCVPTQIPHSKFFFNSPHLMALGLWKLYFIQFSTRYFFFATSYLTL